MPLAFNFPYDLISYVKHTNSYLNAQIIHFKDFLPRISISSSAISGHVFDVFKVKVGRLANSLYEIFSELPIGCNQWAEVSNGFDDWAGRKYELPTR